MKYIPFFFISAFLIISCRHQITAPDTKTAVPYLLVSETWSGVTTNGETLTFSYNSDNLLSSITDATWGTVSYNGGPTQIQYDTGVSYYEYTNGLATKTWEKYSGPDYYTGYQYNAQGQLIKSINYSDEIIGDSGTPSPTIIKNVPQRFWSYSYDADDRLNHILDYNPDGSYNFEYIFSYNDTNNLTSCICYSYYETQNRIQETKYEWTAFDNHVNFIKALNGCPPSFIFDGLAYSSSSPNNVISENYYPPTDIDQPLGPPIQTTYSYEYNDAGLHVKIFYDSWVVTLEYQKI